MASSNEEIALRDAQKGDVPKLAALLAELGYPSRPERVAERLSRLGADSHSRVIVAVDAGGEIPGYVTMHVRASLEQDEPACELTSLVVSAAARGRGIGARLCGEVEKLARARGCTSVSLSSATRRADAHEFYERQGYTPMGRNFKKSLAG